MQWGNGMRGRSSRLGARGASGGDDREPVMQPAPGGAPCHRGQEGAWPPLLHLPGFAGPAALHPLAALRCRVDWLAGCQGRPFSAAVPPPRWLGGGQAPVTPRASAGSYHEGRAL